MAKESAMLETCIHEKQPSQPLAVISDDVQTDEYARQRILERLNKDINDAFLLTDLGDIVKKVVEFKETLPGIKPFYAVKVNNDKMVIQLLANLGLNFDCASKAEIEQVLQCDVHPDRIIFANTFKFPADLRYAKSVGVKLMTFDCEDELHKIKEFFPEGNLVIRLRVNVSEAHNKMNLKFGVDIDEVSKLIEIVRELKLNLVGVSFHVGEPLKVNSHGLAIAQAHQVFKIAATQGYKLKLLDIGGGFPGSEYYPVTFLEMAAVVKTALSSYFPDSLGVQVIAEPGRYFVESAFSALAMVVTRKNSSSASRNSQKYSYIMNDGGFGSFNWSLYDPTFHRKAKVLKFTSTEDEGRYQSVVWGPTCDPADVILRDCFLPKYILYIKMERIGALSERKDFKHYTLKLEMVKRKFGLGYQVLENLLSLSRGDWLLIDAMGAYSVPLQTEFNGFRKSLIEYFIRKSDFNKHYVNIY